jgi:exopolysaccharide biosynthesis protein
MIFMSSTSGSTTSVAELCSVFQAMGVANAIRLDGGPSAAMTVDGVLKNPLTGLYFIKYGTARYIPYALKISYPGW